MTAQKVLFADPFGVQVGVFASYKKAGSYFKKEWGVCFPEQDGRPESASAHSFVGGGLRHYALILPKGIRRSKEAHEVVHIVDFIMDDLGVPCNAENTEVRAYMVDYLLGQLWGEN